ncbi:synaptotagmin-8 [Perognathus longimembris pacificus]|uniref:synaptotagmin-8 n=1 Tax=Perognathus longimembris pacificus TaxID=214514 RepID=UPI00201A0C76|nr:synaptotagmin-8 [Perognathus longimembris pacificus]
MACPLEPPLLPGPGRHGRHWGRAAPRQAPGHPGKAQSPGAAGAGGPEATASGPAGDAAAAAAYSLPFHPSGRGPPPSKPARGSALYASRAGPRPVDHGERRVPGPRWAPPALALAAGVLIACLLGALCRRRRRRRRGRQPGERRAVGLGGVSSPTAAHRVQPDVEAGEPGLGGARQWGRILLSLEYDVGSQEVKVGLKRAAELRAEGRADPCARVSVSTPAAPRHESEVHRATLCPEFEETCRFPVPAAELPRAALRVQLLDFQRFAEPRPLGELRLPLGALDPRHILERWYPLGPPGAAEPEPRGELCLSLQYLPGAGRLAVVVLEARGLRPGLAEPYVKVQLVLNRRKWRKRATSPQKGTAAPYFNQAFAFPVPVSQIQSVDLVLAVWARGRRLRAEPLGEVLLGARASGQPLRHWADMLAQARRPVAQWHRLQPPREVAGLLASKPRRRLPVPGS